MWNAGRFGTPAYMYLARSVRRSGARFTLIAHELDVPWLKRPDLFVAAALQRVQLAALLPFANRVFVTTETRAAFLAPLCRLVGAPAPGVIRVGANALPAERRRPAGPPRMGIFSTAAVGKHFDVVLDAFDRIAAAHPDAELVLIGDLGPKGSPRVREIEESVARRPTRDRVRFTGKLSLDDVAREVADLDVYLFPMETGFNTRSGTLPVAMGAGVPVVGVVERETDASLFRADENVVIAPSLTGPAFAESALRLLDDPALARRVGAGARALYEQHLSWPRIVDARASWAPPPGSGKGEMMFTPPLVEHATFVDEAARP